MRNTMKVAKWEIKRNLKNKSFIIGLLLTPLIFLFFMIVPSLFDSDHESDLVHVYIHDELNIMDELQAIVADNEFLDWEITASDLEHEAMLDYIEASESTAYLLLTEAALDNNVITIYTSDDLEGEFIHQVGFLEEPLRQHQLKQYGFSPDELALIATNINFEEQNAGNVEQDVDDAESVLDGDTAEADLLHRIIPGAFAGIILFSIVISGMMIFQSASQEKKDKIAEIILSSVTPGELMQGKIVGYFVLGIIQVLVWISFAIPIVIWKFDLPVFDYLFTPELLVLLVIAVLGYLLFASLFVGIGATIEDVSTAGNFQGMVLMLPFLPFVLMGPILSDPAGIVAKVGSYIPFTSPAVLILRLSMLEEWPWIEIIIAVAVLLVSVWLFIKLAGKIFKTGILLYGKNATPKEIWKWLWS